MTKTSHEAYKAAGVDLDRADAVVEIAKRLAASTRQPGVLGGIGGFSGAFELPPGMRQPVLLSACDGVGTKLKLAQQTGIHHTVGIDLVAMNVNDILVSGGQPLVFLDYVATSQILPAQFEQILTGIADGCKQAACTLLGGETAEMPGFYAPEEYDLAGFSVGVVEKDATYPKAVQAGDVLIGLPATGPHSNGYSLIRKLVEGQDLTQPVPGTNTPLGEALMAPTRIYVQPVLKLLETHPVRAMVHITGGGFFDNLPRVLPENLGVQLQPWTLPPIFKHLQALGGLDLPTMMHTFNCGVGFVLIVPPEAADAVLAETASWYPEGPSFKLGVVTPREGDAVHL